MQHEAKQMTAISVNIPSASPSLPTFKCRWKDCKAQLHNLDTLRQHISKIHQPNKKDEPYICWWKKCRYLQPDEEGLIGPTETFTIKDEWMDHINVDHLYPVGLKQGDGPSVTHIGKQETSFDVSRFRYNPLVNQKTRTISYLDPQTMLTDKTRYLSDESGRVTTPPISMKEREDLEPDTMSLLKADHDETDEHALKSFIKTHHQGKKGPRAVAEETLRAMAARKAQIGPGIDRGGCILVTEARRDTLIQNQGLQRVVDLDY
jgi:hypothetical protein